MSGADPGSVTDATTRLLETPERPRVDFGTTREAQPLVQRAETRSIEGTPTKALESPKPQQKWMITSLVLIVLLVIVTAVLLFNNRATSTTVVIPPTVTRPVIPPPVPPVPPVPPGLGSGGLNIDPALVYPGSQTIMSQVEGNGNTAAQLHSSDDMSKVAEWYTNKLKPSNVVKMSETTMLEEGDLKVVLKSTGNGTDIFLQKGDD